MCVCMYTNNMHIIYMRMYIYIYKYSYERIIYAIYYLNIRKLCILSYNYYSKLKLNDKFKRSLPNDI